MGSELPEIPADDFIRRLRASAPWAGEDLARTLLEHYRELRRWNRRLSLVGPGAMGEVVERHYGESLAAVELIPAAARETVDIGSGAGFPGLVLAAACPLLRVTLVEPRARKVAFLRAAVRRCRLSCRTLDARVAAALPGGFPQRVDLVTVRALRLGPAETAALAGRLSPGGRVLAWVGESVPEFPGLVRLSERALPGRARRIVALGRASNEP